jgi:hypothetical protein
MELGYLLVLHQLRQREIAAAVQLPRLQAGAGGVHQGQTVSKENQTYKNRAAVRAAVAFSGFGSSRWWLLMMQSC